MKGDTKVIEFLNEALKNELTAINQYWLHYRMLDNWGVTKLAEFERHESIDEMKHADKLAERIFFLDGLPNFSRPISSLNMKRCRCSRTPSNIARASATMSVVTCLPKSWKARKTMSIRSSSSST